ncbi:activator of stress protein 1 [Fusarium langsethiae]|uniref:Activator of stress protein 1 n=1 Tax=Fusarium langsethiae TaxID=179993 RepID=A0A0M9EQX8_FUSLA|nr:activator of stress protein 1 [Fusarium langsethiae]GKU07487.1 unnamed protein product [Fusarium langsethiae]
MRTSIIHSITLGLAGLRTAEASVCKPRSLSSGTPTIASTTLMTSETSFGFASESSTISSTIVSEIMTGVDTSTTDAATESSSAIEATTTVISASTEVTSTAESTVTTQTTASADTGVIDTTRAPTSIETTAITEITTTTTTTTTTTAEVPVITAFQLKGARAPVEGALIYSNSLKGNYLLFSGSNPTYAPATFSIEALSGRLLIDDSLPVCAFFRPNQDIASLGTCNDSPKSSEVAITCTPPAKDGDTLSCSVPAMSCVEVVVDIFNSEITCTPTGEMLTGTSTDFNYSISQTFAVIGQITNGVNFLPHDCHYSPQVRRRRANPQGSVSSLRSPPASELDRALSTGRISTGRNTPATTPVNNETTQSQAIDAEEETEVPREARLVCDAQGKLIFVGDCAPLSFFQSVRQLVTTRVGQNAFAPQSSRYSVLENATAHQSRRTPGDNHIPSVHTDDIPHAVSNYLAIATGLVDLFDHRRLQDDLIFWANMGQKTDDATTIVNLLVLAIGTKIDNEERAQEYFEYAREKAYSNLTGNLSVTTVQMFTLITLYMLCSCQINGAFLFFGTAVRAAYSIGIHRTEVNARFGQDIHRQRDRLWKSLRVVDLFLSTSMGRPPATSDVDCTVPYQSPDENLDESLDLLNASVQIFLVLEGVVTEIYSRRKISLQLTEGISLQLRDWSSRWLKQLKDIVANPDIQDRAQVSGACQILATYYYAVMLVSRPFLMYELCRRLSDGSMASNGRSALTSGKSKLADACIDAASLMVDPILDLIQRGILVGHVPILVSWLFASSLVLGIGLLGGFGRVLEKYTRMAIHALDHCSNHDTHAGQYSLIAQSLLATSLEHLEKRELAERQRRTENSSQLFGLIPSDTTDSPSTFRRETSQPGVSPANVASPLFGDLDSAFLGLNPKPVYE